MKVSLSLIIINKIILTPKNPATITNILYGKGVKLDTNNIIIPYSINSDFLNTPEAKSLNEFRKPLMQNFGLLKSGSAGLLKNGDIDYKINGPVDLIERVVNIGKQGLQINRYKGLGEMNPDQLWETTLDNNYRSLLKVKLDEVDQANAVFETLMGDVTEGRKNFIQENSLKVANLDI